MSNERDRLEELREIERMEDRHAAEKLEEENRRLRYTEHNPQALATFYGVDSSDIELRSEAFDEALEIRRRVSEEIERCETLAQEIRGRLAHELLLLSLHGDDPGAVVNAYIRHFQTKVGQSLSAPEVQSIYRDLNSLRVYADLCRLDPD